MKVFVYFFELFVGDVGVYLGGLDVAVTEHFLDGADVCAVCQEGGGEHVAEDVGGDFF